VVILDKEMEIHYRCYDYQAAAKSVAELVAEMTTGGK